MRIKETIGHDFLAKNTYGQILHFRLVAIHIAGDGRKYYHLTRLDLGHGARQALCYSMADMESYEPPDKEEVTVVL